jgi:hypothetical protein
MATQPQRATANGKRNSHESAIADRKRMYKETQHVNSSTLETPKKQFFLKIDLSAVWIIKREVWNSFFDEASLPRIVEIEYDWILSKREMPCPDLDDSLTLVLTQQYACAIARATAKLADWLMTAAISRTDRIRVTARFREAIWRYCLDFAAQLAQWNAFSRWTDRVTRVWWHPMRQDGALDREQIKRAAERRQKLFAERIKGYWREWLGAIDRGIELRRVLSSGRSTRAGREGGLEAVIRVVKEKNAQYSQREIAGAVDDIFSTKLNRPTPILKSWKMHGVTTLVESYDNPITKGRVKKYITEVT